MERWECCQRRLLHDLPMWHFFFPSSFCLWWDAFNPHCLLSGTLSARRFQVSCTPNQRWSEQFFFSSSHYLYPWYPPVKSRCRTWKKVFLCPARKALYSVQFLLFFWGARISTFLSHHCLNIFLVRDYGKGGKVYCVLTEVSRFLSILLSKKLACANILFRCP